MTVAIVCVVVGTVLVLGSVYAILGLPWATLMLGGALTGYGLVHRIDER